MTTNYLVPFTEEEFYDTRGYTTCLRGMAGDDRAAWREGPGVHRAASLSHLVACLSTAPSGMDVIEICGGRGYVSRICVRRKCRVGPNFDIACGSDLGDENEQWVL